MASSHFGGLPGSDPSSADATGAAGLDLNVLKSLSDRRATRTDGAPPKRRGPKPDSKPALTRRQELNRQAQRTHRERKENYVKALEEEVLRLKEVYSAASQDKNRLAEENRQLKEVLVHHGIPLPETFRHPSETMGSPHDNSYASTTSTSGQSHATGSQSSFSPPSTTQSIAPSAASSVPPLNPPALGGQHLRDLTSQASTSKGYDYEQAGIDFVLTLERPCMDHLPFLLERASKPDSGPCGHALMASCPLHPVAGLAPHDTFGRTHVQDDTNSGQQTWDISKGDLSTLLDLSMKLDLEGEITPVRAWGMILGHPKFLQLGAPEIKMMAEELGRKVRCYGFGAVTEEFEVRDAIEGALANVC